MSTKDFVQYFVVNRELNMSKGKTAAQVAHAATLSAIELASTNTAFEERQADFVKWLQSGMKKIVLKGNQAELEKLQGKGYFSIHDSGLTEIQKGSLTVIALPPMDMWEAKELVGHLTL